MCSTRLGISVCPEKLWPSQKATSSQRFQNGDGFLYIGDGLNLALIPDKLPTLGNLVFEL